MQRILLTVFLLLSIVCCCSADTNSNQTPKPYTSFQTPTPYQADNDIRTDAAIVYSDIRDRIQTWKDHGYVVQSMYGFRTGPEYVKDHAYEVQTRADGSLHTCGPNSYYMVPTSARIKAAVDYFANAIDNGTSAVIPEEPEFFASTGYSQAFKEAWQKRYGEPWQDQTASIEARYKSERLKAQMEYEMVKAIMDSARKRKSSVTRMVACHSPVSYFDWSIIYPHYQCLTIPSLQEIIGQVWTGTARTPCRYAGQVAERTFEYGFLEYSSLYNLARGSGKRMWFLMDPLEDNPDRSMEDYHTNYEKTLVASLMFPEVDAYEVMPWPTRIYGRVPAEFATEISTIINALQDMHNQKTAHFDTGTRGIATLVADSMGWQRGEPHKSDFDCLFGITLPLVYRGVPIQVAQLERTPEKGYLAPYKVLFVSYDILKPMSPAYNQALANWVKAGGVLVFFGGTDAYNDLDEWWCKGGFASPQADLYSRLGVDDDLHSATTDGDGFTEVLRANQRVRDMSNHRVYELGLEPYARSGEPIYVRFRDAFRDDGWGPAVSDVRLTVDGELTAAFKPGTLEETAFMYEDSGSQFNGSARFADADSYWVYKFDVPRGSSPVLDVEMGNEFLVDVSDRPFPSDWKVLRSAVSPLTSSHRMFDVPSRFPLTMCKVTRGQIYHARDQLGSVMFERDCGKGKLIHVGISPAYFSSSLEAADVLRSIASYACAQAGLAYREQQWMGIRRGRYVAERTFDGEKALAGSYVNLLDPRLGVVNAPVVGPGKCAFYCDVTSEMKSPAPVLLFASGKVEAKTETASRTGLQMSGPKGTRGALRLYAAGRKVESVSPENVNVDDHGETVLLTYDNNPESISIEIAWR